MPRSRLTPGVACRSIGDGDVKGVGVVADPEVTELALGQGDTALIVASDGLWDVVSSEAAVGLVHDTVKEPSMCAQRCPAAPTATHPCTCPLPAVLDAKLQSACVHMTYATMQLSL